jgi:predicted metal-dependent phosphotriesterase family hydrolase
MKGGYGKAVWFPTRDAQQQLSRFPRQDAPVAVVDAGGELLPAARECLNVIAGEHLALFTGHVSAAESLALLREARAIGVQKMMVTHALADPARFSTEQVQEAVSLGALIEHNYLATLAGPGALSPGQRPFTNISVADYVDAIRTLGAENCVLTTDLGQAENPIHSMGFKVFITQLLAAGVTRDEIDLMVRRNPARMLDLT